MSTKPVFVSAGFRYGGKGGQVYSTGTMHQYESLPVHVQRGYREEGKSLVPGFIDRHGHFYDRVAASGLGTRILRRQGMRGVDTNTSGESDALRFRNLMGGAKADVRKELFYPPQAKLVPPRKREARKSSSGGGGEVAVRAYERAGVAVSAYTRSK